MQRLVDNGAEVNETICGVPLGEALRVENETLVKIFLEAGADPRGLASPQTWSITEKSALEDAVLKGRSSLIKLILEYSILKKSQFDQRILDQTLQWALKAMRSDTVTLLFQYGAVIGPDKSESHDNTKWIHRAAGWDGSEEILMDLLARRIYPVNVQQDDGQTALHLACTLGYRLAIEFLLSNGASPNVQDDQGQTPLHKAATWHALEDVSSMLLEHGASRDIRDKSSKTASDIAASLKAQTLPSSGGPYSTAEFEEKLDHTLGTENLATSQQNSHDTTIFLEVVRRLNVETSTVPEQKTRPPKRLIDIHTGEVVSGSEDKKYVTVSYIWSPEKYKNQDPAFFLDSHQSLVPGFFEDVVERLVATDPGLIEKVASTDKNLRLPKLPHFQSSSAYFQEVYILAATEAARRGLRYVWLDSVCIDQNLPSDKETEIPFMADYYRGAECCVVISELLRQKLCVGWSDFRQDHRRPQGPKDRLFGWIVPDESLFAWIIGYHHHRVWTFQETFLAREVVVCGSGLRIHASKLIEARTAEHGTKRSQGNGRFSVLAEHFPLRSSGAVTGAKPLSFSHCLHLLQGRECLSEHDRVYGILGLFPPTLRRAVPVDYTVSLSAALANYLFVSVCAGELANLFLIRDADYPPHQISPSPSWLPTGYGSPFESVVDMTAHSDLRFSAQSSTGKLTLCMQYLPISDVRTCSNAFSEDLRWGHHNTLVRPKDWDGHALPFLAAVGVEPLGPWIRNFDSWSRSFDDSSRRNEKEKAERASMLRENEMRRQRIQVAANEQRAVMATFGIRKLTNEFSVRPDMWLWLILCTEDGWVSWKREAIGITGKLECKLKWREFVIY